jgi:hypothetical protein
MPMSEVLCLKFSELTFRGFKFSETRPRLEDPDWDINCFRGLEHVAILIHITGQRSPHPTTLLTVHDSAEESLRCSAF